jgi:hypothetical protein
MMIMEMPRRVRMTARLSGGGLVARFFEPWFFRHRKFSGRVQLSARAPEKKPESEIAPVWPADRITGSNAPLESLAGRTLSARFHAWHGASGQRYICSVFPADCADPDAGLPDFADAITLAVACDNAGQRRCVSLTLSEAMTDIAARQHFIAAGLAAGVVEWHVHLLAAEVQQRHAVAQDIESGCFAEAASI